MHVTAAAPVPVPLHRRHRPPRFWVRALPAVTVHVVRAMPWVTVVAGCATGTALTAVLAHFARTSHYPLDQGSVRVTFLPAVAALAFVVRAPFRAVAQASPVPAWVTSVGQVLLTLPLLALTGWAQLRLAMGTVPPGTLRHAPPVYPLIAQLVAWCCFAVAAAACCDRTRYADVGGTIAAVLSLGVIAVAWFAPYPHRHLVMPPATADAVTGGWYALAAVAVLIVVLALADTWRRYRRVLRLGPRR